jgi:hypothetical protein
MAIARLSAWPSHAHRTVERKDRARRNEVDEILTLGGKAVDFAAR